MTKKELIALADKHQEKADKAYKNYQETGITRYSRDYRNSEDLAAALRMAAKAAEQSNLPSQQEKEDMRGYITAHRTRYLRRMANKRRR